MAAESNNGICSTGVAFNARIGGDDDDDEDMTIDDDDGGGGDVVMV